MSRLRDHLELVRIPNVFTAVADVLAGFLYAGGTTSQLGALSAVSLASACLYCGGMALNDLCDANVDARERPERPIPSGRITRRRTGLLAFGLLGLGLLIAWIVSRHTGGTASILVALIVGYDAVLKQSWMGPVVMGACRAANLLLGLCLGLGSIPDLKVAAWPMCILGLYVVSLTFFARCEASMSPSARLYVGMFGVLLAVLGSGLLPWCVLDPQWEKALTSALSILWGVRLLRAGNGAAQSGSPKDVQPMVARLVMGIVLLDALLALGKRGPWAGLAVAAFWFPTKALKRRFRMS